MVRLKTCEDLIMRLLLSMLPWLSHAALAAPTLDLPDLRRLHTSTPRAFAKGPRRRRHGPRARRHK